MEVEGKIGAHYKVFFRRLASGGIFNNRLLSKNKRLLCSLLFLEIFVGGQGLGGGGQSHVGGPPLPPTWENAALKFRNRPTTY